MKTILRIENLRCFNWEKSLRCNNSITKALSEMESITNNHIDETNKIISFNLSLVNNISQIVQTLRSKEYPQKGEGNIFHKAISYIFYAIGKLSK